MSTHRFYPLIILLATASMFLTSCVSDSEKTRLQASSGGTLELLVVTDNTRQWEGAIGDTIKNFFGQEWTTLPQPEPMFTIANLEAMKFSKMFRAHHNILIVTVDEDLQKPFVETKKNLWAKPQRVIKMNLPDESSFFTEFEKHKGAFMDLFYEIEWERSDNTHQTALQASVIHTLKNSFQLQMNVPVGYKVAKQGNNFIWIRREAQMFSQGIMVYVESYTDTNQFHPGYIIGLRDSLTKKYIPGPRTDSYMTTATSFVPPEFRRITMNGNFTVETRGLWETEGDFMGGPFVSYTTVDEKRNRIITLDGYVYYPNHKKRILMHQVDAILRSVQF